MIAPGVGQMSEDPSHQARTLQRGGSEDNSGLSLGFNNLSVYVFVRVHACVCGGRVSHLAWKEQIGWTSWPVSPREPLVSPVFPALGLQECVMPGFLHGCWGIELRSSSSYSKPSAYWTIFPASYKTFSGWFPIHVALVCS